MIKLQAHRGVCYEYPENTISAYQAAVDQGYDLIECDPKFTKDGYIVLLHDRTLNRTARDKDGNPPAAEMPIKDITLQEARQWEYGSWKDARFKGEPIPTLSNLLDFAEKNAIPFKFDNVWETFPPEMQEKFFDEIEARGEKVHIGFTCRHPEMLKKAADRFPHADLHYDGGDLSAERLNQVAEIAKGHHLYIWVCYDNQRTAWFKGTKATPEVCRFVRQYGELGVWILAEREELAVAMRDLDAQIVETDGRIKPAWTKEI